MSGELPAWWQARFDQVAQELTEALPEGLRARGVRWEWGVTS